MPCLLMNGMSQVRAGQSRFPYQGTADGHASAVHSYELDRLAPNRGNMDNQWSGTVSET